MNSMRRNVIRLSAGALLMALAACGESTAPGDGARLVLDGYAEVGETIQVLLVEGTDTAAVAQSAVAFKPANAAQASFAGNGFVLTTAGQVEVTVTRESGDPVSQSFTIAPATRIVFDMVREGNRDIYVSTLDGSDVARISTHPGLDQGASAVGRWIAWVSHRDGNGEVYRYDLIEKAPEARSSSTSVNESDVALAPTNGSLMAFVTDDGGLPRVRVGATASSAPALLPPAFGSATTVSGSPAWSAGGDSLLFMATVPSSPAIYLAGLPVGSPPRLLAQPGADSVFVEPTWSIDGRQVAFAASRAGGSARIAVLDRPKGTITMVTPENVSAGQPAFIADGRIVFTIFEPGSTTKLAWVDPRQPLIVHDIPVTGQSPQRPAIIWP